MICFIIHPYSTRCRSVGSHSKFSYWKMLRTTILSTQKLWGRVAEEKHFFSTRVHWKLISFLDSILISCIMRWIESYHFISMDKWSDPRYHCCSELHTEFQWRKLSQADVRYCSGNWFGTSYSHSNVVTFSPWKEKNILSLKLQTWYLQQHKAQAIQGNSSILVSSVLMLSGFLGGSFFFIFKWSRYKMQC